MTDSSSLKMRKPRAPLTPADGSVERMVIGWIRLSVEHA